ncbi:MAG: SpoIID/LytB domain-containing protein [Anaerotignaceae bacterium]
MKKILIILVMVCFFISGCTAEIDKPKEIGNVITESKKEETEDKLGDNIPVLRSVAAKMIALAMSDSDEITSMDNETNFSDVAETDWYYPYINRVCYLGYMQGTDEGFMPNEPLNLYQAQILVNKISNEKIQLSESDKDKAVSYRLWCQLFVKALEGRMEELELTEKTIGIFATTENGNMPSWTASTSDGVLKYQGYALDAYVDKTITVIVKEDEIVGILDLSSDDACFENAYVSKDSSNQCNVVYESGSRTLKYSGEVPLPIGTITVRNGEILSTSFTENNISGTIKLADGNRIFLEDVGDIVVDDKFKIYDVTNENQVVCKGISALTCGSDIANFYRKNDIICGAIITKTSSPKKIRTVIGTTNFQGYIHSSVSLSALNGMKIMCSKGTDDVTELNITADNSDEYFGDSTRIYISPKNSGDIISITSIERNWTDKIPKYSGTIEIEKREDGFVIVNEVDMETYIEAVVPSEMPTSYGIEAAKVQAVSARSYAYNQYFANKYHSYGANVDDSVLCQVYNNVAPNETSKKAAKETEGICLTYNDEVISANFFSTSCGTFASSGEVWASDSGKVFPAETKEYLQAHCNYEKPLNNEENIKEFLKNTQNSSYDSWVNWYRWSIKMTGDELSTAINKNIEFAWKKYPLLVKTMQTDGSYKSRSVSNIGKIKSISVIKRGDGGNIMELKLAGETSTVLLKTEYVIRTILRPVSYSGSVVSTVLNDGKQMANYAIMPSAFFTMDITSDANGFISEIAFTGGGNGHGVGMSQNGVKGMADSGFGYSEILQYYYKGTQLNKKL